MGDDTPDSLLRSNFYHGLYGIALMLDNTGLHPAPVVTARAQPVMCVGAETALLAAVSYFVFLHDRKRRIQVTEYFISIYFLFFI